MTNIAEIYFRAWKKASGEILEVYCFELAVLSLFQRLAVKMFLLSIMQRRGNPAVCVLYLGSWILL